MRNAYTKFRSGHLKGVLNSSGSGQGPVAAYWVHDHEPSVSIKSG